jgi:hypothetical protein
MVDLGTAKGAGPGLRGVVRSVVRELDLSREEVGFLLGEDSEAPRVKALFDRPSASASRPASPHPTEDAPAGASPATPTPATRGARKTQRSLSEFAN